MTKHHYQMKQLFTSMLLTLATALPAVAQSAGDNIRFALMPLESDEIPAPASFLL